uniref:Uncharacterized protein n=1 Tax=Colletotrichum fructicola (strain Nara gc5) TaxID=1213859 RepID=L2G8S3_COLFN
MATHRAQHQARALHPVRDPPHTSSFTSFLANLTTDAAPSSPQEHRHTNPHATPTPVDAAALYHLLQQQFQTLFSTAPNDDNARFLSSLVEALESDINSPPSEIPGVSQEYLDSLDRVPKKSLGKDEACPICAEKFLDDQYPLIVELPCHRPRDLTKKKEQIVVEDDEENDDPDGLYA